ncbi:MAG: DUF1570 domain-containing protein [Planctomycetaceae bacterium]
MLNRRLAVSLMLFLFLSGTGQPLFADYSIYTLPGTRLEITLAGEAKFNPGGTVTHRHPRGTLYFNARDIRVIKSPTPETVYARQSRAVIASGDVEQIIELAKWAVRNGMIPQCKALLSAAWKIDPTHAKLKKLAGMVFYLNKTVEPSESAERHLRDFVRGRDMSLSRSKHFVLLHNGDRYKDPVTGKTRAEMRLELMETVYESYFLSFAFNGMFLRPPTEPMEVVLFSEHADFLQFASLALGSSAKQLAGFYLPSENVSVFFDNGTGSHFRQLMQLSKEMQAVKEDMKKSRVPGGGEVIRLASTLELLVDITRESEDVATVSHEAVHQLAANSGLFPRDATFVRWVHEGLASYFESSKNAGWRGAGVVDHDRIDYYRVLEGDPVRGSLEFIVSDLGFLVEASLGDQLPAYGQAWALTHYLINCRFEELMKFYKLTHGIGSEGTTVGEKADQLTAAFKEAFGDMASLELEWRRYMRTLRTDMELLAEEK